MSRTAKKAAPSPIEPPPALTRENVESHYRDQLNRSQERVRQLAERLLDISIDPAYTLDGGEWAFRAAGHVRVSQRVLTLLGKGTSLKEIRDLAYREAISAARGGTYAASGITNVVRDCVMYAWADTLIELDSFLQAGVE